MEKDQVMSHFGEPLIKIIGLYSQEKIERKKKGLVSSWKILLEFVPKNNCYRAML